MKRILSIGKDDFYPQIFRLAVPIIIQNLLSAAVNSADVIMLNYVGQSAISAVSLAANYSNILFMVYYGIGTGASLLCSQYAGKKDFQAIHVVEGIALRFSVLISLLVALVAFTAPQMMLRLFTNDPELITIGSSYIRIMGVTYIAGELGDLSGSSSKYWKSNHQYGAEYAGIYSEYIPKCSFYLRPVRCSEAWCNRRCNRHRCIKTDPADWLCGCIFL